MHFALAVTAMMAMAAMFIDLGLLMVQRRFNQNAADAVALAVGRKLQTSISLDASQQVQFAPPAPAAPSDLPAQIAVEIAKVFGPGKNEHTGFTSRTVGREWVLEYSADGGASWCHASPTPSGLTGVTPCGGTGVPLPSSGTPFLARVTISTTTTGFFTGFANAMGASGGPCYRPPDPAGGPPLSGTTTCAQATVSLSGSLVPPTGLPIIPASVPDCWVQQEAASGRVGGFYHLWGDNDVPCPGQPDTGSWKHLLDFSPYRPNSSDPPDPSVYDDFHGAQYAHDPSHPGERRRGDIAHWIANGYGGTIHASPTNGSYLYTGPPGNAVGCSAKAFYGHGTDPEEDTTVSRGTCDVSSPFFADSKLRSFDNRTTQSCVSAHQDDPVAITSANIGCRDVAVIGWDQPQVGSGLTWSAQTSGTPGRVRAARIYVFRLYCRRNNPGGPCDQRVDVGTCNGASGICGRLVALPVSGSCPTCTSGPSVIANMVRLQS